MITCDYWLAEQTNPVHRIYSYSLLPLIFFLLICTSSLELSSSVVRMNVHCTSTLCMWKRMCMCMCLKGRDEGAEEGAEGSREGWGANVRQGGRHRGGGRAARELREARAHFARRLARANAHRLRRRVLPTRYTHVLYSPVLTVQYCVSTYTLTSTTVKCYRFGS